MGDKMEKKDENANFFSFRKMFSLTLIKIIYVLGMLSVTISGIVMVIGSASYINNNPVPFLIGIAIIILGNLIWRILCEGWILLFSVHEQLVNIAETSIKLVNQATITNIRKTKNNNTEEKETFSEESQVKENLEDEEIIPKSPNIFNLNDRVWHKIEKMHGRINKIISETEIEVCNKYGKFIWKLEDCIKR